jgi:hypothetical protein
LNVSPTDWGAAEPLTTQSLVTKPARREAANNLPACAGMPTD